VPIILLKYITSHVQTGPGLLRFHFFEFGVRLQSPLVSTTSAPLKMFIYDMNFISALAFFLFHFLPAYAVPPCYMLNGDLATSDFQPCTSNVLPGSNSACCNTGKNPPDICLNGGLYQRMDSLEGNFLIYAVGCTDRSGKDPACPQYCPSTFSFRCALFSSAMALEDAGCATKGCADREAN